MTLELIEKCAAVLNFLIDKQAEEIVVIDISGLSPVSDYMVVCHGNSERQVQAIAEFVVESMKEKRATPIGVEGVKGGRWALLDYGDIVVHIFLPLVREYYDVEGIWADAPHLDIKNILSSERVEEES